MIEVGQQVVTQKDIVVGKPPTPKVSAEITMLDETLLRVFSTDMEINNRQGAARPQVFEALSIAAYQSGIIERE